MPEKFEISEVPGSQESTVIRVAGHLDARSTPNLVERCRTLRKEGKHVVINLSRVSFIASSGIGGLLTMIGEVKDSALAVRLAEPSSAVRSVINLLNLDKFLIIDRTETAAIEALEI